MKKIILLLGFLIFVTPVYAANHYVDCNSAAGGDGTTTALSGANAAWDTIADVNGHAFSGDDNIYFAKGCTWRENLIPPNSGTSGHQITFDSYGTGNQPRIYGSELFTTWTAEAGGTNLLATPEAFASWLTTEVTGFSSNSSSITDPHGGNTADGIIGTTADAQHQVYQIVAGTAGQPYTFSVFAAPGNKEWVYMLIAWFDSTPALLNVAFAYFQVPIGTVGANAGTTATFNYEGKNNFRRIGFSATAPANTALIAAYIIPAHADGDADFAGDATTVNTWLWGGVLENAASASHYGTAYYASSVSTEAKVVYQDGTHLKRCTAKGCLVYGSFWWDDSNDRMYVKATDLADPDTHTMELGQRDYSLFVYNKDYITVKNIDFRYSNSYTVFYYNDAGTHSGMLLDGITIVGGDGFASVAPDDLTIQNSTISNVAGVANTGAVYSQGGTMAVTDTTIEDNHTNGLVSGTGTVTGTRVISRRNGDGTYLGRAGFGSLNTSIMNLYNCTANNNEEDGFSAGNASTMSTYYSLAYNNGNTLSSSANYSGDGWTAHTTATLNVYYSIGYGNYKSGLAVTDASAGVVYNNVFYNNYNTSTDRGTTPWLKNMGIGIDATGDWLIKNNITYGNECEILISATGAGAGTKTVDYNLYYDSLGGSAFHYNGTDYNFANWKTNSSKDAHSINSDPLFVNLTGYNFRLKPASPARNAGTNVSLTSDYLGRTVPYGSAQDIGAYEYYPVGGKMMLMGVK